MELRLLYVLLLPVYPQGSILGPLLFLVYINDIMCNIHCNIKLFANDTSLMEEIINPATSFYKLNQDLDTLNEWSKQWIVTFNASKTELLIISKKCGRQMYLPLYLNNTAINEVTVHKHLRVIFNNKMSWRDHINDICKKCNKRLDIIQKMRCILPRSCIEKLYKSFIRSLLDYTDVIYDNCCKFDTDKLEHVQCRACIIATGAIRLTKHKTLLQEVGIETLKSRRRHHRLVYLYKIKNKLTPSYLSNLHSMTNHNTLNYNFQRQNQIIPIRTRTTCFYNSFFPATKRNWNNLPLVVSSAISVTCFKNALNKTDEANTSKKNFTH